MNDPMTPTPPPPPTPRRMKANPKAAIRPHSIEHDRGEACWVFGCLPVAPANDEGKQKEQKEQKEETDADGIGKSEVLAPSSGVVSEVSKIQQVKRWKTSDLKEFSSFSAAEWHALEMDSANRANAVLGFGGSVADALRKAGWDAYILPILARVTKDTKLAIPHWQCRDEHGYQVLRFNADRSVWVFGNAGSWSGPYGNDISIADLITYATNTLPKQAH